MLSLLFQSSLLLASEPVPTQHLPELGIEDPVEAETCTSTESTETTAAYDWVTGMGQKASSALAPPSKCPNGWCIVCLKGNECGPLGFCSSQPARDGSQSDCKVGIPRALCEQLGYRPIVTPGKDRKCTKTGVPTEDLEKFLKDYPSHVPPEKNGTPIISLPSAQGLKSLNTQAIGSDSLVIAAVKRRKLGMRKR